jgi:seryl-tRNA synthetase
MNATGLGLAALLIVVLFAVVLGAQQLQDQQAIEIAQLMKDRDSALTLAHEATAQRDVALAQIEPARERVAALEAENEEKEAQIAALSGDLTAAREDLAALQKSYTEILSQANEEIIPVTSQPQENTVRLQDLMNDETFPWTAAGAGLLAGVMALSGGGYLVSRIENNRRVTVHMTREQLREYIRYQRSIKQ